MKKLFIILISLFLFAGAAHASLWNYYNEQGLKLPTVEERMDNAVLAGIADYSGTASQNERLEAYLRGLTDDLLGSTLPIAGSTYNLADSGTTGSATSITLQSLTITQTGQKISDSDLSDTFYLTLEPGNKTRQEIASCTTVTQNAAGTATLSGCARGLSPISPYTASTTLRFSHAGGSQVIFSDPPQLFNSYPAKDNASTISGAWGFSTAPTSSDECIATSEYCTKAYIDNSTNQGAATSTEDVGGIAEQATQIESASSTQFDINNPHYQNSEHATSTPNPTDNPGIWDVWSENDGKLSQNWYDLTESWAWTGKQTYTATTTYNNNLYGSAFFGSGADGAFTIATTSRKLDPARDWNFTTFSVPAGKTLTHELSDAILRITVQGDCDISGTINLSGLGATSSPEVTGGNTPGRLGVHSEQFYISAPTSTYPYRGSDVAGGNIYLSKRMYADQSFGNFIVVPGSSGGGGTNSDAADRGGKGGRGGGALILECGGSISGAGLIDLSGTDGQAGATGGNAAGGGGAGGGGMGYILYGNNNSFSGTTDITGGVGGSASIGSKQGGGGAGSYAGAGILGTTSAGGAGGDGLIRIEKRVRY